MVTTYLPISAHARLTLMAKLRKNQTDNALSDVQASLADMVFSTISLAKMRKQALREMVAAGYTNQEIRMVFADPDSPYSILIEALEPKLVTRTIKQGLDDTRKEQNRADTKAALDEYIQTKRRLIDATWATLADSGAAHHKSLLDFINQCSQDVAEALNIRVVRAGRASTKKGTGAGPEEPESGAEEGEKPQDNDVNWNEEFEPADENPE